MRPRRAGLGLLLTAAAGLACSSEPTKPDVTVATLNILHGLACSDLTRCRQPDRIALLFEWVRGSGCPDLVTLQEVSTAAVDLIQSKAQTTCAFAYQIGYRASNMIDDEMILSRFPVRELEVVPLQGEYRNVLRARIAHPAGPVDVFTTHLGAATDGQPCGPQCPSECVSADAATVLDCQSVQLMNLIAAKRDATRVTVVSGDFNALPGSFAYRQVTSRSGIDTYLAAGGPECDPQSGVGCTSGREDRNLSQLESRAINEAERIDYLFLLPPAPGSACQAALDSSTDGDHDGIASKLFADAPDPFAPSCGAAPLAPCWPSDHEGVQADINCTRP